MALMADGWHMSSHALAIGMTFLAYAAARKLARDARFAFGTWKIEVLTGFASAILLLAVAAMMVFESVERLLSPQRIFYAEAIGVAVLGLCVNVASAFILGHSHDHGHHYDHAHNDHHDHHDDHAKHEDLNLKAAYVHVIADAATSVLEIAALIGGWLWGADWLDPLMGIVGAVLVAVWAKGLIVDTGTVLFDREMDSPLVAKIHAAIESLDGAGKPRVADLHLWRVGQNAYACTLTVVTHDTGLTANALRHPQTLALSS